AAEQRVRTLAAGLPLQAAPVAGGRPAVAVAAAVAGADLEPAFAQGGAPRTQRDRGRRPRLAERSAPQRTGPADPIAEPPARQRAVAALALSRLAGRPGAQPQDPAGGAADRGGEYPPAAAATRAVA